MSQEMNVHLQKAMESIIIRLQSENDQLQQNVAAYQQFVGLSVPVIITALKGKGSIEKYSTAIMGNLSKKDQFENAFKESITRKAILEMEIKKMENELQIINKDVKSKENVIYSIDDTFSFQIPKVQCEVTKQLYARLSLPSMDAPLSLPSISATGQGLVSKEESVDSTSNSLKWSTSEHTWTENTGSLIINRQQAVSVNTEEKDEEENVYDNEIAVDNIEHVDVTNSMNKLDLNEQ
jgi:hypothetical protein